MDHIATTARGSNNMQILANIQAMQQTQEAILQHLYWHSIGSLIKPPVAAVGRGPMLPNSGNMMTSMHAHPTFRGQPQALLNIPKCWFRGPPQKRLFRFRFSCPMECLHLSLDNSRASDSISTHTLSCIPYVLTSFLACTKK